ncbi:DUF2213 domain-containing protein [Phyllobacterium endophyticum]|uniref:DUF2213 domain-containing protein n=1 Tax=Phyllobacterium endophyticum TaxID=1149773 RepID=A0A2P7AUP6_9HYPH|nr:DUF2213 domain-containing protein [Phyllobacterium endophyticum]MBB3234430.1 hypothetical protein [Phyllobacterium endophyticum]PSH57942.1 hypothetical protein CU100_09670 [Phyllobacterium endophyticum]TYR44149.1 DUF2213 domain-containing protein [Phyllobacterium endophyticum]
MQFTDAVTVAGTRRRDDGYLVADARIARTGIQNYHGSEVGKPDMALVRVYRPGSEVFSDETLRSAAHRPVTNDHPDEHVTSKNWKDYAVGQTGDEVTGEGIFIRVPLMVSDESAISDIEAGKQELSAGYTCDLDWTAGTTPTGEAYDAIQKNIRLNHVAIVQQGRAGNEVRIGDANAWGVAPITNDQTPEKEKIMTLKTVTVDGIPVEVTDQGATVIGTLQTRLADANTKLSDAEKAHQTALAAKDAEIARKDAEIDATKAKVLSDADLDKRVQARADLITVAKAIAQDVKTEGLTDAAIRKAAVVAKLGDEAVKDKADAYIDARFDILAEDAKKVSDPFRTVVQNGIQNNDSAQNSNDAYTAMLARDAAAWQGKKESA